MIMEKEAIKFLFERQVHTLIEKGYPELAGLTKDAFLEKVNALEGKLSELSDVKSKTLPFVIVVKGHLVTPAQVMPLISVNGKVGKVDMNPVDPSHFSPIEDITLPPGDVYLLADIDTGKSTLNSAPNDALKVILQDGRTPLTIDEGVSLMLHFPEVITSQNAYSMLASRSKDKKVPAMWISYGNLRLGWCWAGNPHTWLGSASAVKRIG